MKKRYYRIAAYVFGIALLFSGCNFGGVDTEPPVTTAETSRSASEETTAATTETAAIAETSATAGDDTTAPTTVTTLPSSTFIADAYAAPAYNGRAYVKINNNVPQFSEADYTTESYERYSDLDALGRCGVCMACVGRDLMPTEDRGTIGSVKPSGWHTVKYDIIDGKYLYSRAHLIAYQLAGENANTKNLITGTRFMNLEGMTVFESMVATYVRGTGNHVLYRVTPIFKGNDLLASGVQMEAYSVEDQGDGVSFNVYCYNVQPGIDIDYATGESKLSGEIVATTAKVTTTTTKVTTTTAKATTTTKQTTVKTTTKTTAKTTTKVTTSKTVTAQTTVTTATTGKDPGGEMVWIPTNGGSKYHSRKDCSSMIDPILVSKEEAIQRGYAPCKRCH